MKFPYEFYRDAYFPVIPLILIHGDKQIKTFALVDSGARISMFSSTICKLLGLKIEAGEKSIFQGVSAKLAGYMHTVRMIIADKEITCKIAFSDELSTSFNLLGRQNVFDKFLITFNERLKEILIEPV